MTTATPDPWLRLVEADRVEPQPWRNGGGVTRELLRLPFRDDPERWILRLSLADIDADGPFSAFPGVDRHFAVIAGAGVRLHFRHRLHTLVPGDAPLAFDGIHAPACSLVDGPTRDLNVMVDRRAGRASLALLRTGEAWSAPADVARGVFVVDAVRLRCGNDAPVPLPARTLAWCSAGDSRSWSIEATDRKRAAALSPAPLAFRTTFDLTTDPVQA